MCRIFRLLPLASLALASCSEPVVEPPLEEPPVGALQVTVVTTGPGAIGQLALLLDDEVMTISPNTVLLFEDLSLGDHALQVVVPGACTANHFAPQTVEIEKNLTTPLEWNIRCPAPAAAGLYFTHAPGGLQEEVWRINPDGSNPGPVGLPGRQQRPVMNPARTRLAWVQTSLGDGRFNLWISDPSGANAVNTGWYPSTVSWSPDGRRLLVAGGGVLAIIWPDGTTARTLRGQVASSADWSPDGKRVAYQEGFYHFVMDLETEEITNTLNQSGGILHWSPDGARLGFVVPGNPATLTTMRADGTDVRELRAGDLHPDIDWLSDGTILFSERTPGPDVSNLMMIYRIPATGGTPMPVFTRFDAAGYAQPMQAP